MLVMLPQSFFGITIQIARGSNIRVSPNKIVCTIVNILLNYLYCKSQEQMREMR